MSKLGDAIVVLGAGGHARVVLAMIRAAGGGVRGCIAPHAPDACWPSDVPWLGEDTALDGLDLATTLLANGVGSIGDPALRRRIYEGARARGFHFPTLRHPAATIDPAATLGEGAQVMAGAVVQVGARVGENALVNTGALIDHDVSIGAHVHLAPGVTISGGVMINEGVHVGVGASILQGLSIGAGALVGAGAVVIRNVAPGETVIGVPAAPINKDVREQ